MDESLEKEKRILEMFDNIVHTLMLMEANITRITDVLISYGTRIRRLENGV